MAYDPKCEELAKHFIGDRPVLAPGLIPVLAQEIQDTIDIWLESMELDDDDD